MEDAAASVGRLPHDLQAPAAAMREYVAWLSALPGKPVFVGYPAAFDFMFVHWYLIGSPARVRSRTRRSTSRRSRWRCCGRDYRELHQEELPKRWFDDLPHTHVALDDAIEQGALFCNMLREWRTKLG